MHYLQHIIGLCPDNHSHIDLLDFLVFGGSLWISIKMWFNWNVFRLKVLLQFIKLKILTTMGLHRFFLIIDLLLIINHCSIFTL